MKVSLSLSDLKELFASAQIAAEHNKKRRRKTFALLRVDTECGEMEKVPNFFAFDFKRTQHTGSGVETGDEEAIESTCERAERL
jgi:hypothetical protein